MRREDYKREFILPFFVVNLSSKVFACACCNKMREREKVKLMGNLIKE